MPYRIDRLLNEAKRLRRVRREDLLVKRRVTPRDADRGLEKASGILRTLEADGVLSVEVLDEFCHSIRVGIRGLMRELRPKTLVFNDMAPKVLHGRTLRNRQGGNVVRGISAVAMLAIEERLTIAVRYLLVEHFKEDHVAVEPDYDLGEHQRVLDLAGGSDAGSSADDDGREDDGPEGTFDPSRDGMASPAESHGALSGGSGGDADQEAA